MNEMNTTMLPNTEALNSTDYYDYYDFDEDQEKWAEIQRVLHILSMVIYGLAFVLGVTGNGLVIWITGFKMKKTVNVVWFLNLAIADFIFTFVLPLSIAYTAMKFHWPFGKFLCKLNSTIMFLNMFCSIFFLTVISIDRLISVVFPVWSQNHRTTKMASIISLMVWLIAFTLSSPYFAFRDTGPALHDESVINCFNNFAFSADYQSPEIIWLRNMRHQVMVAIRFLCGFLIPFCVIIICYAIIALKLKRNRLAKSSKPFKVIIAVIVTFFLCWAPYHVLVLVELFNNINHDGNDSNNLMMVIHVGIPIASSLAFLNSCLNPILYVFMGQDFKEKFRQSILSVFESAFSEESAQSNLSSKSKSKCSEAEE
uniref:Formyl peptide receptor 1 n=2 Tax=Latimeria chalumnae TaxID=7897 RepID=H3B0E0_LATCH